MAPPSVKGSRPPLIQLVSGVLVLSMVSVITYMYRVIDSLYREQQAMREQLSHLTNHGDLMRARLASPEPPSRPQRDFLESHTEPVAAAMSAVQGSEHSDQHHDEHPHVRGGPTVVPIHGRRMASIFTTGVASGSGCFNIGGTAGVVANGATYDVSSSSACDGNQCPDCFITPEGSSSATGTSLAADVTVTISNCASAQWVSSRSLTRSGVWVYTFINADATYSMTVTDGTNSYTVPTQSYIQAWCTSSLGTANRLIFPSTTVPTLTVESGLTVSAGNFDHSSSSGTFKTGTGAITLNGNVAQDTGSALTFATSTGAVSLNGATTVADSTTFTVGSAGSGGAAAFYGAVNIGGSGSGQEVVTTFYGNIAQNDANGGQSTFSTATGAISLNGDVTVASGKDLTLVATGAGTLTTGTGQITLNGNVLQAGSNTFTTGSGAIALNGATTVADSTTFTVGSAGSGGAAAFYGAVNIGGSGSGQRVTTTVYGDIAQNDGTGGTSTFSTGTGAVSLNGDVTVAAGKDLTLDNAGAGTFATATGQATFHGNVLIDSTNTFTTGSGAVSLQGTTTVADGKSFSVGSAGNGGTVQLFGDTYVGGSASGASSSLTVYGNVAFNDDGDSTVKTFSTATGAITLSGDVSMAQDKNLHMHSSGSGTFQTGTGAVTLNGNTEVSSGNTFQVTDQGGVIGCTSSSASAGDFFCKASGR